MTPDPATIRAFLARTRPLCDAATEGPWHAIETEEIESAHDDDLIAYIARMAPRTPSRPPFPLEIVLQANASAHGEPFLELSKEDAAFIADARGSLPEALNIIEALLEELGYEESALYAANDVNAIVAAVRLAADAIKRRANPDAARDLGLVADFLEPTDLGRAVCDLAERMESADAS